MIKNINEEHIKYCSHIITENEKEYAMLCFIVEILWVKNRNTRILNTTYVCSNCAVYLNTIVQKEIIKNG